MKLTVPISLSHFTKGNLLYNSTTYGLLWVHQWIQARSMLLRIIHSIPAKPRAAVPEVISLFLYTCPLFINLISFLIIHYQLVLPALKICVCDLHASIASYPFHNRAVYQAWAFHIIAPKLTASISQLKCLDFIEKNIYSA